MTTDGLRPATPGNLGDRPHRQEIVQPARGIQARIDGAWIPALVIAQRQTRNGAPWELCLQYRPQPGQNHIGWFAVDEDHIRDDDTAGNSD